MKKYNIIFLDMDGVVNNEIFVETMLKKISIQQFRQRYCIGGIYYIIPQKRDMINKMIEQIQDCRVVWSSSWRNIGNQSKRFAQGLYYEVGMKQNSLLDITPRNVWGLRSDEIKSWIDMNKDKIKKCVVIDDMEQAWGFCPQIYNDISVKFVKTDIKYGLTEQQVDEIKTYFIK